MSHFPVLGNPIFPIEFTLSNFFFFFNFLFYYRRKAKSKAPLPPPETKITDCSSFDDLELANCTMDQKENAIDRDIQLSVLLPGEVIKTTNVNGRYVEQKFEAVLWMKTGFSEGCVCIHTHL